MRVKLTLKDIEVDWSRGHACIHLIIGLYSMEKEAQRRLLQKRPTYVPEIYVSRAFFYMFSVAMAEEKHPLFLHCPKCQDMLGGVKEEV